MKYPVRVALNPFISTVGWTLPTLISGATITAVVLNLPTTGPLLIDALLAQDMFLAGSFIMLLSNPHRDRHPDIGLAAACHRSAHPVREESGLGNHGAGRPRPRHRRRDARAGGAAPAGDGRRERSGGPRLLRVAVAAHAAPVLPPQGGGGSHDRARGAVPRGAVLAVPESARSGAAQPALQGGAADGAALLRAGAPARAVRVPAGGRAEPGDLRERLPGGSRAALPGAAVRTRVHLQAVRAVRVRPASVRHRRRGRAGAPVRHRRARPRRVLAHPVRRPDLAVGGAGRGGDQLLPGHPDRRRGRLLRRHGGRGDPAHDRDHHRHSQPAAVDGAERGAAHRAGRWSRCTSPSP